MTTSSSVWTLWLSMSSFVLLWGSAAIFTRWGLDHSSVLALLIFRFALALVAILLIRGFRHPSAIWPRINGKVALAGLLMIGCYSICYFQAMAHGITPGLLATILGIQPILTLLLTERLFSASRLCGLILSLLGLSLVVYQSLILSKLSGLGLVFALGALLCMTLGTLLQKRIQIAPLDALPLQLLLSLLLCLALLPSQAFDFSLDWGFVIPLLWLGLVISVAAQLLLYRMIQTGNLVNVTSLFYLVPIVTVLLDYLILDNQMPLLAIVGMGGIIFGLILVFKTSMRSSTA